MENICPPPYPGPPLETTSSVKQRPYVPQPAPRTRYPTVEQSPGPQHHSSLPMENIPVPPYPGPPLDSLSTSSLQPRAYTHQTPFHTDRVLLEGGPHSPLHSPAPQCQRFHCTHLHSPHPQNPCQCPESFGTSGLKSPVLTGAVTDAYHACHDKAEGVPCKNLHNNPTFYSTPNKHSDPPPPYPGFALNLQSSDTPKQFRPGAMLSGAFAPGRVSQGKQVLGDRPDKERFKSLL
ncbi:extensin-2-like isoform X1 [Tachysurus ichikawai]